jgi:putative flippase GtrA
MTDRTGRTGPRACLRAFATGAETRKFVRFLLVGGLNTVVGYLIFAALYALGTGYAGAAVGSTVLGAAFNFRSTGLLVFGSRDNRLLPRFLLVYTLQCAANIGLLRSAIALGVATLVAEAFILPLLAILTYLAMRRFVFRPPPAPNRG